MAEIPDAVSTDPVEMLGMGRRHLAVKDYSSAITCLGKACELLAKQHGQQADECGEAYFWYGKSLLGMARMESGVLGDGIPGGDETQEDEDADEEVDEDNNDETDKNESESKVETAEEAKEDAEGKEANATEEKETNEAKVAMDVDSKKLDGYEPMPSSSASAAVPSSSGDGEAVENEEDDEIENLQLAWEVFELARDVFLKRGENGKKELAEVYLHLGEVSIESEMYDKAISDMTKSLELFIELYSNDDRRIAETHYQIGLAHSLSNGFDDAIEHFKKAANILETRIKNLKAPAALTEDASVRQNLSSDPFYSIDGEIEELTELLPEIKEKVQDMMDYKAEAIRSVRETLGLVRTNGESSKENGSTSSAPEKKASDISHLVKRKRNPDEVKNEDVSAAKRPAN